MGASRVSQIAALQRTFQSDATLSAILNKAFDAIGFTDAAAREERGPGKRKAIKDTVWGMLDFSAFEMRLIDSPLMQRMRNIHQLGFSYLTYPSADHTRFIHSLGMAHVVANFIAGIDRDRSDDGTAQRPSKLPFERFDALLPLHKRELLYAALLHDVGHMPFSHASEAPLANNDDLFLLGGISIADRLTAIRFEVGKQISLSEAISVIIVLSERFETFYKTVDPVLAADQQSIPRIASLIAGTPTLDGCPNIQEIISAAAVDADKIDYVNRDAKACGISVGVDVSRIFLGGGLIKAPRNVFDSNHTGSDTTTLFVVNSSGADTLDEIVQARSSLYQRVYLHPLTRTAEALFARALQRNAQLGEEGQPYLADAISLWALGDQHLLGLIKSSPDPEVASLGLDIALRRMPKKACAFAGGLVELQTPVRSQFAHLMPEEEGAIRKDVGNSFLEVLTGERIAEIGTTYLEDEIKKEANLLAATLEDGSKNKLVPVRPLNIVVVTWIAIMGSTRPDAMVFQNGDIVRTPALTNVQGQLDAHDIFKAVGYVLCDPEWRQIVFQAARVVLHRESRAFYPSPVSHQLREGMPSVAFQRHTLLDFEGSARRANLRLTDAQNLAFAANKAGYYDDTPILAIRTDPADTAVQRAATKYDTFDGEGGWRVRSSTVAAFVDQFPPALRQPLLSQLAQGTYLDQADVSRLLVEALTEAEANGFKDAVLVPLSSSSGGAVLAAVKPALRSGMTIATSIEEALAMAGKPILLVDDNAASGVQSSAQLFSYSGLTTASWPVELQAEKDLFPALTPGEMDLLKSTPVGIVTAVGTPVAAKRLAETAKTLGLAQFSGLRFGTLIGKGLLFSADLNAFLEDVGRELMAQRLFDSAFSDLRPEDQKRCSANSLGFGNYGGITVTNVNVPASTVTALWQPGSYKGRPWIPLFLRRGRYRDLLLA